MIKPHAAIGVRFRTVDGDLMTVDLYDNDE